MFTIVIRVFVAVLFIASFMTAGGGDAFASNSVSGRDGASNINSLPNSSATSPPAPKISATPVSVNLGSVALGASSVTSVITVWNKGKSALTITSVNTTGTDGDEFSQTNNCGTIQPAGSCLVNVIFTPNLPYANKTAILAIASDDPKKPTLNLKLSGQLPPPAISATPASVNLGSVALGASSAATITVWNKGKSALTITSVNTTGTDGDEFSQTNTCGTVQPAGSCLVNVTFTPNLLYAKKTAILAIASNDPKKPTLNVKLSGQLPPPAISATPASLNFGKLPAGTTSSSKSVTIGNKGLSDLEIDSIDISGSNPDDFTAAHNCGTIHQSGTCTIDVLFAPLAPKVTRSASMIISSNDPKKSTITLKLTGNSTDGPSGSWDSSTWDNATWAP